MFGLTFLTKTRKRAAKKRPSQGCFSTGEFHWFLERERERTDRTGVGFSLLACSAPESESGERLLEQAVSAMHERLRMPDVVGRLDENRVAAIMPATTAIEAWKVADEICEGLPEGERPQCKVYYYPTDWLADDSGDADDARRRIYGERLVEPMEPMFVKPLPAWKRAIDIIGSGFGLLLLSPLFALVAAAVKVSSPGPVFFEQERLGLGGKPFVMRKFRSMVVGAEARKATLMSANEQEGPVFKIKQDPRVTRIGRLLRSTSIDELPQLLNVLRGEMSLVGPRPLEPKETSQESWQRRRLDVTPGLTCIWQVRGRSEVPFTDWMRMDIEYIRTRSLMQDLKLILLTIPAVVSRKARHNFLFNYTTDDDSMSARGNNSPLSAQDRATPWRAVMRRASDAGSLALLDQAVFSGTNFLTTVIIGRTCGKDELGVYALAFTIVVLVACAQESLLCSPYTVFCHRLKGRAKTEYAGSVLVHQAIMALAMTALFAICGLAMFAVPDMSRWAILCLLVAGVVPFALTRDFARRMRFAHLEMASALLLDAVVAALQIGGLLVLAAAGALTPETAFVVMGASCAVAVVGWFVIARRRFSVRREKIVPDLERNWKFGRWVFAALMALMIQFSAVPWLLAFIRDTGAAGALAACISIVMLGNPIIMGVSNLLMPKASLAFADDGPAEVKRVVLKTAAMLGAVMTVFYGAVVLLGDHILHLLYGNEYSDYRNVVTVLAFALLARAFGTAAYNGLRVIERPDANLKINLVSMVTVLAACPVLIVYFGVTGAAFSLLAGDLSGMTLRWAAFLSVIKSTAESDRAEDAALLCQRQADRNAEVMAHE